MANDRVSQAGAEVLVLPDSAKARTTVSGAEVLIAPTSGAARTSQLPIEVLLLPTSAMGRVSHLPIEALFHKTTPPPPTSYLEAVLYKEPWAWYRMGEPSGTDALDSSGNDRHGTYNGGPTLDQSGGIAAPLDDGAVLFDAVNDYLRSPSVFNFARATMIVWFLYSGSPPGSTSWIAGLVDGDGAGTSDKWFQLTTAGKAQFVAYDGAGKTAGDPNALSAGWHMLAGRADGSTLKLFVDSIEVASVACGNTYASYTVPNVHVGGANSATARLAGKRDEFMLFNYALTDDEIEEIWTFSQLAERPSFRTVIIA